MEKRKPIKIVEDIKSDLDKYRRQFETKNKEHERAYYGDVWENDTRYKPVENQLFQIIETMVPVLTDGLPGMVASTDDMGVEAQVANMSKAISWINEDQKLQLMMPTVVRQALIGGPGFIHEYYDANADNGDGKICREVVHWESVWLDGSSPLIEGSQKARFEVLRSKEWLKAAYPKYKKQIEDVAGKEQQGPEDNNDTLETRDLRGRGKRRRPQKYSDRDTLKLCYTYLKDYSMVKIPEEVTAEELAKEAQELAEDATPDVKKFQDHEAHIRSHFLERALMLEQLGLPPEATFEDAEQVTEMLMQEGAQEAGEILFKIKVIESHIASHEVLIKENPQGQMFKYPFGWRVIKSVGKVVVYDGPIEYDHGEIPLTPFYCYKDNTVYGFNEIENLIDSQRMQTVLTYKAYKGLQRVANPGIKATINTGLKKEDFTNEDGQIFLIPEDSDVQYMDPGQISSQVVDFGEMRNQKAKELAGQNEVSEGKSPHPNASGVTVEKLQLRSIGRQRLKIRNNIYYSLDRLGRQTLSNINQFWTTEKVIGVDNSQGFDAQVIYNPLDMQDIKFKVKIDEGSMAGVDKEAFNGLMYALLAGDRIDLKTFLKFADIPKKNELMEDIDQTGQQMAMMQELEIANLMLRYEHEPESLSEEEAQIAEEYMAQQGGVSEDQPPQPEGNI